MKFRQQLELQQLFMGLGCGMAFGGALYYFQLPHQLAMFGFFVFLAISFIIGEINNG